MKYILKRKKAEAEIIGGSNDDLLLKFTELFHILLLQDTNKEIMPGVVSRLLEFLNRDDYQRLQCEAARVLKGISKYSPDNINMLIDHGVIPILASLLRSPKDDLRKQAIEMLGNMALNSPRSRDLIHSHGVFITLMALVNDKTELSIMRSAVKTLSIFCDTRPQFEFELEQVKPALHALFHLIHTGDEEVIDHACHVINYLISKRKDIIQAVIDAGFYRVLFALFQYPSRSVLFYALRIVANIIQYGDDILVQVGTCFIIAKIITRTKDNFQVVIDAGIVSPLFQLLQNDVFEIRKVAARAFYEVTTAGTNEQIKFLMHEGCIKPLCDLLVNPNEVYITGMCLEGLGNILEVGEAEKNQGNTEDVNVFAKMIDDAGGLQKIKNLLTHDDSGICEIAMRILGTYWQEEDDEQLRKEVEAEIIGGSNDDQLLEFTELVHTLFRIDRNKEIMPGVVSRLLEFLNRDDYPRLQCEAARALTGISKYSPDNINMLIDHGVIPILASLLRSPKDDLRKRAIKMLGYMACNSPRSRDLIDSHGVCITLMAQVNDKTELSIVRSALKTLSIFSLTVTRPQFELDQVKPAIHLLSHLIHTDDKVGNVCHILYYLIDEREDIIQAVIDAGVFPRLIELSLYPSRYVLNYALRIVANIIVYGDDILIQAIKCLLSFLVNDGKNVLLHPSWFRYIHFANSLVASIAK
ncbi:unnamed protein product [Fraxinus pennsylvanica]|uniref:Uncharacterized protein n=1 Tax=Fraxinus pennsylvanica TaxID=56036 RepID=A0AAD2E5V9_9LAMI|nr:unnamed protein product [Fraxinus pennsylvanica]